MLNIFLGVLSLSRKGDIPKELEQHLGELQRKLREKKIPLLIIFEGPSAAGRGRFISALIQLFDSRGYRLITASLLSESVNRIFFQKYWLYTPEAGRIAIYERSYYGELVESGYKKSGMTIRWIKDFEKTLAANGTAILKIYLEISKKEQKKRLKKLEKNKNTRWRVSNEDWKQNKNFADYTDVMDNLISETSTSYAPWLRINANDLKTARRELLEKTAEFMDSLVKEYSAKNANIYKTSDDIKEEKISLDDIDLSLSLSREEYKNRLDGLQEDLLHLELKAYRKRLPVIIVFEGCDAAGKGGAIRRLIQGLDPRGVDVIPVSAPDKMELSHHYLWRFWKNFPKKGHFVIFDRSWYGRVLVERVEGFCDVSDWRRAYDEINEMEYCLYGSGALICKFWLQISPEEQLRRFRERETNEYKKWKITEEDWRNREKWKEYKVAAEEMLYRTNTSYAPWTIVEAESKLFSRIKIISTVVKNLKDKLKN